MQKCISTPQKYCHESMLSTTHWERRELYREVAHHPGVSNRVLCLWGISKGADMRAEECLTLGGGPHTLVQLVEDDSVLR